jgi:hypothetical protein
MCTAREVHLVASVMKNRINHRGFGNGELDTMEEVAYQSRAFSCVGDRYNFNWTLGAFLMRGEYKSNSRTETEVRAWNQSLMLSLGDFVPEPGIVYYHDKSIGMPCSWCNRYWTAVKAMETEHFVFYTVKPTEEI